MRSLIYIFSSSIMILVFSLLSCGGTLDPPYDYLNDYYTTSFENDSDLSGWDGISIDDLRNDAPPNCGSKSVYISGGCGIPHASLILSAPGKSLTIQIGLYAKVLFDRGVCEIFVGKNYQYPHYISIRDTNWAFYQLTEDIDWPSDSTLTINLNSGGFTSGAMLVDALKVKIVN